MAGLQKASRQFRLTVSIVTKGTRSCQRIRNRAFYIMTYSPEAQIVQSLKNSSISYYITAVSGPSQTRSL